MSETKHVPDIMEVISDLSNDEVRTPPIVARKVLDLLPRNVWSNPDLTWFDPGTKSGVFLREIALRLMVGLEETIPNEEQRIEHILHKQLFGAAVTELSGLISRRALYCSKEANSSDSVVQFKNPDGNIFYSRTSHMFKQQRCTECGAKQEDFGGLSGENHAYSFIHQNGRQQIQESMNMKFDVIVGNPPYQISDASDSPSASPIYNEFVDQAIALNPEYIAMVIPSRWMTGGKGLDSFRKSMLEDKRIQVLVDYFNAAELFPQVGINGGICYFLWNRSHSGECKVTTYRFGKELGPVDRILHENDVFVRDFRALSILNKVQGNSSFAELVSSRKPFGIPTNFSGSTKRSTSESIELHQRGGIGWVSEDKILSNSGWIDKWKVLVRRAGSGRERDKSVDDIVIFSPHIAGPGSACTETYIVIGPFDSQQEAKNAESYIRTKFFRFLLSLRKAGQDAAKGTYSFIPQISLDQGWDDDSLAKLFGLSEDEIELIEQTIKGMQNVDD